MKINFRKISAIAVSALMTGMTLGVAAAANYPAPFVSGGVANVAVVYGTGTGVSSLDQVQAGNIQTSLGTFVEGGAVTVEGGESFLLEKTSDSFNFGDALNETYTDLDDQEMSEFLADGTYNDGDIDEDYTQTITLGNKALSLFTDNDYNDDEPTIGFRWTNNENILDYDINFDSAIAFEDLEDTDFPLMGKEYYVLDVEAANDTIVLLDSADKTILTEGEEVTVGDKTVSIEYISETEVKFNVDGEITVKLGDHDYEELDDGSYIVANEVMYNAKEVGYSKVEFSLGQGKITLIDGEDVEVNDEAVDGLGVTFDYGTGTVDLDGLNFAWASDDETYLTEEDAITMPVFETIKLIFGGLTFPDDPETISLDNGETMVLNMGNYDLDLFHITSDATYATLGAEDYALITATNPVGNYTGNASAYTFPNAGGIDLVEDNRFIVTSLDADLSDTDTLYYEVTSIDWTSATDLTVELKDLIGDNDLTFEKLTDTETKGTVTVSLNQVNDTHAYLKFAVSSGDLDYNTAVSDKGLEVTLPEMETAVETNDVDAGVVLTFTEADNNGDLGLGTQFTATVKSTTNEKLHVSSATNANVTLEEDASDTYVGYVLSDLASKITTDETGDEYDFEIEYFGEEVTADVEVNGGISTTTVGESTLGNVLVKDTEVSSVATKNLIVVGGSCINSAAAALVGGAKCGAAWTTATGVGTGQFLIKGYATSSITSKLALLVAGYDAADTVKATTYLTNKVVDTSKAYKGTTSTELAVVIE